MHTLSICLSKNRGSRLLARRGYRLAKATRSYRKARIAEMRIRTQPDNAGKRDKVSLTTVTANGRVEMALLVRGGLIRAITPGVEVIFLRLSIRGLVCVQACWP